MDKFVKDAFKEAMETHVKDEFKAWCKFSEKGYMDAYASVVMKVGIERMNNLCGMAVKAGQGYTFAEYTHILMMMAFHKGYAARRDEEG